MPNLNDGLEPQYGNIIAIEGNADLVATQLRLLPPSSKILLLPALSTALPPVSAEPFEARRWVRHVYNAFTTRTETARSFIQSSTSSQPRLVFINGGSVSARVECIFRIAEQLTNGRIDKAEAIFNEIVKDGAAGLLRPDDIEEVLKENILNSEDTTYLQSEQSVNPPDYRGAVAMEAADRLDSQTVDLQSTLNLSHNTKYYEVSTKYAKDNEIENRSEISSDHIRTTVVIIPNDIVSRDISLEYTKRDTFGTLPATTYSPNPPRNNATSRESLSERENGFEYDEMLPNGDRCGVSPGVIEVGQAQVIRVDPRTLGRPMRSVKSVDGLIRDATKTRRRSRSLAPRMISARAIAHRAAALKGFGHGRRASLSDLEKAPLSPFVRASPTTIKKTSSNSSHSTQSIESTKPLYVDRGTDARDLQSAMQTERAATSFEPVFGVIEDLVIHFTDGANNSLLESVVRSYKNGSYPVIPICESDIHSSQPNSPQSVNSFLQERLRHLSHWTAETDDSGYHRRHEINPYSADNIQTEPKQPWWPQRNGTRIEFPAVSTPAPLSPAATPPLSHSISQRFHRFSPINSKTATGIQNSLRAVLNVHFPPELTNYRQYSVPGQADRLWKPVFRDSDGYSQEGRTVDLIIAIGAEEGVGSNFFNEIAGQVERLGTKKNGTTRSGKLDMRFLIASAMQTFTMQSLSYQSQSSSSPFSSPMLLASLLVPQLETYLANNVSTRLLILHYSSSHLPTILALRHLVGVDTLKIAGILDSSSSNTMPNIPIRLVGNRLNNANVAAFNARTRVSTNSSAASARSTKTHSPNQSIDFKHNSSEPVSTSFARANYLLPSTATEVEIATFLSNITHHLIEKSSYYTPEPIIYSSRKSSPLSPSFPPIPKNTTSSWKTKNSATTPPVSNSSRPMEPQSRERECRVGQSLNNNALRTQSDPSHYAEPIKATLPNNYHESAPNSPSSNRHFTSPSITSISSSIVSNHHTYSSSSTPKPPFTNSTSTSTIFNSSSNSNATLNNNQQSYSTHNNYTANPDLPNTEKVQVPIRHSSRPSTATLRPTTADARERQSERDWANFYIGDSDEDDEIDRILMPRIPRRVDKRRDTRKALKFLGLN